MPLWLQKILRYEPGISLAQWVYDRIANNWTWLLSFSGATLMTGLGAITDWSRALGPAGIAGLAIFTALFIWVTVAWGQNLRAKASERRARAEAIAKWKEDVDQLNPMLPEFHATRVRLSDLVNPITNRISNKRMIDCELIGPANVLFLSGEVLYTKFTKCDLIVLKRDVYPINVIILENSRVLNCQFMGCTIYIPEDLANAYQKMGATFLTYLPDESA